MKPRSPHLTVVAVVAAFALGSAGTAVAGPALSKGAVKKIATKVVKKAAPKLSVASAATAGNADRLDGLDSSDLTTSVHRFTLPVQTSSAFHSFSLPGLPNGTYLVTYDILTNSGSTPASCAVVPSLAAPSNTVAEGHSTAVFGSAVSISGSAVFTSGGQTAFECQSSLPFMLSGEVDLTRVDTVTTTVAGSLP
jgi:hypothetical protein